MVDVQPDGTATPFAVPEFLLSPTFLLQSELHAALVRTITQVTLRVNGSEERVVLRTDNEHFYEF